MIRAWSVEVRVSHLPPWHSSSSVLGALGQTLIDLADPATMLDVKRMMHSIKPNFTNIDPWWTPKDWFQYALIAEAMSEDLGVNKNGQVAYVDDAGKLWTGKWPPGGTVGFPSFIGIQNMAGFIAKLDKKSAADLKKEYPKIASYGINVTGVKPPIMKASPPEPSGGGAEGGETASSSAPWLWGLGFGALVIGAMIFGGGK